MVFAVFGTLTAFDGPLTNSTFGPTGTSWGMALIVAEDGK